MVDLCSYLVVSKGLETINQKNSMTMGSQTIQINVKKKINVKKSASKNETETLEDPTNKEIEGISINLSFYLSIYLMSCVQNLDRAVCISLHANTLGKGKNPSVFPSPMGK